MRRMRRGLCGVLCLVLLLGLLPAAALAEETGGQGTHWAQSAVDQLNKIYGLPKSDTESTSFSVSEEAMTVSEAAALLEAMGCSTDKLKDASDGTPENLTRSQACEVLADVFSLPVTGNQSAIQYLFQQNIISGTSANDPDESGSVSQAEFAVLTYRVLNAVGGGLGSSNKALKPGTDEYFAWMYLAARSCVPFNVDDLNRAISSATVKTIVPTDNNQWTDFNKSGEDLWNAWAARLNYLKDPSDSDNTTISGATYNGNDTLIAAAVQIVKAYIKDGGSRTIFSDVPADSGFYDGVMYLFDQGLISGNEDGTFEPDEELPRYQLAALLARIDKYTPDDTDPADPIEAYKQYAVEEGYMVPPENADESWWGSPDSSADSSVATREEAAIAIVKACADADAVRNDAVRNVNTAILDRFTGAGNEVTSSIENAEQYIAYAVAIGILSGNAKGSLALNSGATRGAAGVLLYRTLLGVDKTKMKDYEDSVSSATKGAEEPDDPAVRTFALLAAAPGAEDSDSLTLTLREDWRLTSPLDLEVPEGKTLTIIGDGHYIYEMGGTLENSGLGKVVFSDDIILYPAGTGETGGPCNTSTSDLLMMERQPHTVTVSDNIENGSVTISGSLEQATKDTPITLTVQPNQGYRLTSLTCTATETGESPVEITASSSGSHSFSMPASDVTISAVFSEGSVMPAGHTITFDAHGGSVTPTAVRTNESGTLDCLPTPIRSGYAFLGWYLSDGTRVDETTVFTQNTTLTAHWAYIPPADPSYQIAVPATLNGAVTVSPTSAKEDQVVTITVTPNSGYELTALTVTDFFGNQVDISRNSDGTYSFVMPASQVTVSAVFAPAQLPFTDVTEANWYYDEVYYVWANGLMQGTSASTFGPNVDTTRAMVVTILWRLEGEPASGYDMDYSDVAGGAWYAGAVRWATEHGIVNGSEGQFYPGGTVTREQLAAMLYRYAQYKGYDLTAGGDLSGFADAGAVSGWAETSLEWAVSQSLIQGSANQIDPTGSAIRAQLAAILMRFMENVAN